MVDDKRKPKHEPKPERNPSDRPDPDERRQPLREEKNYDRGTYIEPERPWERG